MIIDLHCHSTYSDGLYGPNDLLKIANAKGCQLFSITDHDTISGNLAVLDQLDTVSLHFITGVELSILIENTKFEVLGYNFDINSSRLIKALNELQEGRVNRMKEIIKKLNDLDFRVTIEEVQKEAMGADSIGRPHIARVMVRKGYVASIQEAFDLYLAEGKPAYVRRKALSLKEAIDIIVDSGGIAVVPHPLVFESKDLEKLREILDMYISNGAQGVEVYYDYRSNLPELSNEELIAGLNFLERYCIERNLLMTVGSDFHGDKGSLASVQAPRKITEELLAFFKNANKK